MHLQLKRLGEMRVLSSSSYSCYDYSSLTVALDFIKRNAAHIHHRPTSRLDWTEVARWPNKEVSVAARMKVKMKKKEHSTGHASTM